MKSSTIKNLFLFFALFNSASTSFGAVPNWLHACMSSMITPAPVTHQLFESMRNDQFHQSPAFLPRFEKSPAMKALLRQKITHFERSIYRTSLNVKAWNSGYDVVVYKIYHTDGTQSILQAFKHTLGNPFSVLGIGSPDRRSAFNLFYISVGHGQIQQFMYQDNELTSQVTGDFEGGLAHAKAFIEKSLENRGLFELQSPDQIL